MTEREQQASDMLRNIAQDIEEKLPENFGFTLLAYEFGDDDNKKLLYISNSQRDGVMQMMAEFLQKNLDNPDMFGKDV